MVTIVECLLPHDGLFAVVVLLQSQVERSIAIADLFEHPVDEAYLVPTSHQPQLESSLLKLVALEPVRSSKVAYTLSFDESNLDG